MSGMVFGSLLVTRLAAQVPAAAARTVPWLSYATVLDAFPMHQLCQPNATTVSTHLVAVRTCPRP
jgi:hypothetical protein